MALERPSDAGRADVDGPPAERAVAGQDAPARSRERSRAVARCRVGVRSTGAIAGLIESADERQRRAGFSRACATSCGSRSSREGDRVLALLEALDERNLSRAIPGADRATRGADHHRRGAPDRRDARVQRDHARATRGRPGLRGTLSVVGPTRMHYPRNVVDGALHVLADGGAARRLFRVANERD